MEQKKQDDFYNHIKWRRYNDAQEMIKSEIDVKSVAEKALHVIAYQIFRDRTDHYLISVNFYRSRTIDFYRRTGQMDNYNALKHQPLNCIIENLLVYLLNQGIDFEHLLPKEALDLACQTRSLELVKLFVEKGQNVNITEDLLMEAFDYMRSYLDPNIELVNYLIEKGANVNWRSGYPCKYGDVQLLKLLIVRYDIKI